TLFPYTTLFRSHVHPPQELAQHDAFVDALTLAQRIARVGHLFPVLERRAAIIAPELGSRVERRKVDERFSESPRLPVRRAAAQVLRDVEPEGHRELLFLDGRDIEVGGRRDPAFR